MGRNSKHVNVSKIKKIVFDSDKCQEGNRWVTRHLLEGRVEAALDAPYL